MKRLAAGLICIISTTAHAQSQWLDKASTVTNRQWIDARLSVVAASFPTQPKVQASVNSGGGVDVNLYYTSTRLLLRTPKEREDVLKAYVFDPIQKGINEILARMPGAANADRPNLAPSYNIFFLRTEAQQYIKVAAGSPGSLQWDEDALGQFSKDLRGGDLPQGSLFAKYEPTEAQWLSMQLSVFSLQNSDPLTRIRCVVSKDRRVACRYDHVVEKPKGGQAKEFYGKKREEISRRITSMNDDLDRIFALEGREVRFSSRQQLTWDITINEGEGPFSAGKYDDGALTWNN